MLSRADFVDLFPGTLEPELEPPVTTRAVGQRVDCIARWEDDGGRIFAKLVRHDAPTVRSTSVGYLRLFDPARAGLAFTTMCAAAAYCAVWAMLSTYDGMMEGGNVDDRDALSKRVTGGQAHGR